MAEPVTRSRLVQVSRQLLVEGGQDAVVVREVARRLGVTAPALYKHVAGRDDLLTLLISACFSEVAATCAQGADAVGGDDPAARLRAAAWAFRCWARDHPAEFVLLYGSPVPGYAAPQDGPTTEAARTIAEVFLRLYGDLVRAGRLRTTAPEDLPPGLAAELEGWARATGTPLTPSQLHPVLVGWQQMLGLALVETGGHLAWALGDTEAFVADRLDDLVAALVLPDDATER